MKVDNDEMVKQQIQTLKKNPGDREAMRMLYEDKSLDRNQIGRQLTHTKRNRLEKSSLTLAPIYGESVTTASASSDMI